MRSSIGGMHARYLPRETRGRNVKRKGGPSLVGEKGENGEIDTVLFDLRRAKSNAMGFVFV